MGLLDRFRTQPKWRHADASVRAAAVDEIPLDEQELLVALAREDHDAGVRLAAVKKILDPRRLGEIGRDDPDPRVREGACGTLVEVASGAFEGSTEDECLAALDGLSDGRHLASVAEAASLESVRRAALGRIEDSRTLASVARRSEDAAIRLEALARVSDDSDLASVALKCEHKDVALAALERIGSRETLEMLADRAKSRAVAKRARAMIREADEAAAARAAAEAPTRPEEPPAHHPEVDPVRQRQIDLCRSAEAVAKSHAFGQIGARLDTLAAEWAALDAQVDPDLARRFEAACQRARAELVRREAEEAADRQREAEILENVASRTALCEAAEAIDGDDAPARVAAARAAWVSIPALPAGHESRAAEVSRRFEVVLGRAVERHRARVEHAERRQRAERLVVEIERLASGPPSPAGRGRLGEIRRAWEVLNAAGQIDEDLAARASEARARVDAAATAAREGREREQRENLARLSALCARLESLVASEVLPLKDGEHGLRDARASLATPGPLPSKRDHDDVVRRLRELHARLAPRVRELREEDEWKRWANAGVQEELCRKAEALAEAADPGEAAKQLAELQARWREVATASRDRGQELWARFHTATDEVRKRCDGFFASQAAERAANLAKKEALCQRVEQLAGSSDWIRTADEIKRLQAEWKTVGPVPRGHERTLWDRFRTACDSFFTRRQADLAERKEQWAANLTRKEALIAQAEVLAESTEWETAAAGLKRLQAEWKTVGPVRRKKAEAVWQRFRAACDRFFERYQHRNQVQVSIAVGEREAICADLEALAPPDSGAEAETVQVPAPEVAARVRGLYDLWRQAVAKGGAPRAQAEQLEARFVGALSRAVDRHPDGLRGSDLDPEANRRKLEDLCARVERLRPVAAPAGGQSGASMSALAEQLREALAANTMAGRAGAAEAPARLRPIVEEVRQLQAAWKRVGPVAPEVAATLGARFQRSCDRFFRRPDDQRGPAVGARRQL